MSTVEQIVDVLADSLEPRTTREKLIAWGWISPSGESLDWTRWCRGQLEATQTFRGQSWS